MSAATITLRDVTEADKARQREILGETCEILGP